MTYFATKDLAVGYDGNVLIHDINIDIEKGKILTLIGPNGAGKSTILKSVTDRIPYAENAMLVVKDGYICTAADHDRFRIEISGKHAEITADFPGVFPVDLIGYVFDRGTVTETFGRLFQYLIRDHG